MRYFKFDIARWKIDLHALSAPANRDFLFDDLVRKAGLDADQKIALVRLTVTPSRWRQSPFARGPMRRALIIFPFSASINEWFKAHGYDVVEFDAATKGWLLLAHTDAMLEAWLRNLLDSHFDLLLVEQGSKTTFMFR